MKITIPPHLINRFLIAITFSGLMACEKEPNEGPPSEIQLESDTFIYYESDPNFYIPFILSKEQFSFTQIEFEVNYLTTGTEEFEDLYIKKDPIVIYGGNLDKHLEVSLYNDVVTDGNDTIEIVLSSVHGNVTLDSDPEKRTAKVILLDDDNFPNDEMHFHLNWSNESGSLKFEADYDLDLYLLTDVIEGEHGIISAKTFSSSEQIGKFEDLVLKESDPDQEYYITVHYRTNSSNVDKKPIQGLLKLSGFGFHDEMQNRWQLDFEETGYYYWIGPFKKEGTNFTLID
jgi:hypothetical protein